MMNILVLGLSLVAVCYANPQFVRLTTPGETCSSRGYTDIVTKSTCDLAFDTLSYGQKTVEEISTHEAAYMPNGCFSECYTDYYGHHCRKFNQHSQSRVKNTAGSRFLCKTSQGEYVRLDHKTTCEDAQLRSIDKFEDCTDAFGALKQKKGMERIDEHSYSFQPKGCFSTCFDVFSGHTCRTLNTHPVGNGKGAGNDLRILCQVTTTTTPTTTTPTTTTTTTEDVSEKPADKSEEEETKEFDKTGGEMITKEKQEDLIKKGCGPIASEKFETRQSAWFQNVHTGRRLFVNAWDAGREAAGEWLEAPKVRAADNNYYLGDKFFMIKAGAYYILEHIKSGRYVFGQGSCVKGKEQQERGWRRAPPVVARDAAADAYYSGLHLWQKIDRGDTSFFRNAQTGRYLMAQDSNVSGYTKAPQVVNSDANYYNLAAWRVHKFDRMYTYP